MKSPAAAFDRSYFSPWRAACPGVAGVLALVLASAAGNCMAEPGNPLNGERAYGYLKQICDLGPRPSGSKAMREQQELLIKHFSQFAATVERQPFRVRDPLTSQPVEMANLIVRFRPDAKKRVLLCAHYDTRPRPDNEPNPRTRRSGRFIGANDGASGVAVLMELAHVVPEIKTDYGIDFVLFDGEELVYGGMYGDGEAGEYFLGSTWFAQQYRRRNPASHEYRWGILLDMVGDRSLGIYQERHSVTWRDTRPLVQHIWATAARLGVDEFIPRPKYLVRDDHLPLRNIGKIPTCDVIDFEYPAPDNRYWHSEEDLPNKCSPESLAKVGWVMVESLRTMP